MWTCTCRQAARTVQAVHQLGAHARQWGRPVAVAGCRGEKEGEGGRMETVCHVVEGAEAHRAYKASWIERWMSRDGLEQKPKWMEVLFKSGAKLMSPFCSNTVQGREVRERVLAGDVGAVDGTVPKEFNDVLSAGAFAERASAHGKGYARVCDAHECAHDEGVCGSGVRKSIKSAPGASGLSYAELQSSAMTRCWASCRTCATCQPSSV